MCQQCYPRTNLGQSVLNLIISEYSKMAKIIKVFKALTMWYCKCNCILSFAYKWPDSAACLTLMPHWSRANWHSAKVTVSVVSMWWQATARCYCLCSGQPSMWCFLFLTTVLRLPNPLRGRPCPNTRQSLQRGHCSAPVYTRTNSHRTP